ncbi:hypothetical protein, partial [Serratia bockelmannii]|uniref:hypothetical protein n=1 Tax=Serratia bockelmannii TaxID=2703793 RepID=UPI003CEB75E8
MSCSATWRRIGVGLNGRWLIIGYGQFGLRIEPLLLVSAAITAALAWWQGYRWDDIIEAI